MLRERNLKSTIRSETKLANNQDLSFVNPTSQTVDFFTSNKAEMKRKALQEKNNKNLRVTDGVASNNLLKSKVLELFEKYERLPFKDLATYCKDIPGFSKDKDLKDIGEIE